MNIIYHIDNLGLITFLDQAKNKFVDRWMDGWMDRYVDRQTGRQIARQTDRQADRQLEYVTNKTGVNHKV